MTLVTVEQQRQAVKARCVGARAERYQREWMAELRRRGIIANGSREQRQVGSAAQSYKSPVRRKPTTLATAAKAFDIALAAGKARYKPVPALDSLGHDYALAARERLPQAAQARADRLRTRRF